MFDSRAQELLRPFNTPCDYILMRRQTGFYGAVSYFYGPAYGAQNRKNRLKERKLRQERGRRNC
jgi:hypothetical protein